MVRTYAYFAQQIVVLGLWLFLLMMVKDEIHSWCAERKSKNLKFAAPRPAVRVDRDESRRLITFVNRM